MKYLLDTHSFIWYLEGDKRLSKKAVDIIEDEYNLIFLSNASLWEIAIKISIGKLKISLTLSELEKFLIDNSFQILNFNLNHLEKLLHLPFYHNDPFDRLIISQVSYENIPIITSDDKFKKYKINIIS